MKLNKKGFTLVELMVVIVIIGILAAIIIPNVAKNIEKANQTKALSEGKSAYSELIGILDLGTYTMSEKFTYYDAAQKMSVEFKSGSADLTNLKTGESAPTINSTTPSGADGDTICINNEGVNTFYYFGLMNKDTGDNAWYKYTPAESETPAKWEKVTSTTPAP